MKVRNLPGKGKGIAEQQGSLREEASADLAACAFAGGTPAIRVSDIQGAQDAIHLPYGGVFGFIRNQVHHKLLSDLAPERVVQILALIDYLLYVANTGAPSEDREVS